MHDQQTRSLGAREREETLYRRLPREVRVNAHVTSGSTANAAPPTTSTR